MIFFVLSNCMKLRNNYYYPVSKFSVSRDRILKVAAVTKATKAHWHTCRL